MLALCRKKSLAATFLAILCFALGPYVYAQSGNSTSITGTVVDPSGAVVVNAAVEVQNPVSGYSRNTVTDSAGKFTFPNVPFNPYHLTVTGEGFAPSVQDVDVRSSVPINLTVKMNVPSSSESVTVETSAEDLLENTPTFHTDVDREMIDKTPSGKRFLLGKFAGHARLSRCCRRFQRPLPRPG